MRSYIHLLKRGITPKIIKVKLNFFRKSAFCCSVLILGRHGAWCSRALPKTMYCCQYCLKYVLLIEINGWYRLFHIISRNNVFCTEYIVVFEEWNYDWLGCCGLDELLYSLPGRESVFYRLWTNESYLGQQTVRFCVVTEILKPASKLSSNQLYPSHDV